MHRDDRDGPVRIRLFALRSPSSPLARRGWLLALGRSCCFAFFCTYTCGESDKSRLSSTTVTGVSALSGSSHVWLSLADRPLKQHATMPNLPQEVLADILSDAVPKPPCHDYAEWWERQRSLASFALVHTSWTSIAQELLFAECRILSRDHEILRKAAAGLVLTSGRVKTQWLTVTGDLIALLEVTGFERWKDVTYLVHAGDNTFLTPPERYGKFPREFFSSLLAKFALHAMSLTRLEQHDNRARDSHLGAWRLSHSRTRPASHFPPPTTPRPRLLDLDQWLYLGVSDGLLTRVHASSLPPLTRRKVPGNRRIGSSLRRDPPSNHLLCDLGP